jgi:hypothetical protein
MFIEARKLCRKAVELDDSKHLLHPDVLETSINCVKKMHDIAEILAGDRIGEIYDKSDEEATA